MAPQCCISTAPRKENCVFGHKNLKLGFLDFQLFPIIMEIKIQSDSWDDLRKYFSPPNFVRKEGMDDEIVSSSFKYEEKDITIQEILLVAGYLQWLSVSIGFCQGESAPHRVRQRRTQDRCAVRLEYWFISLGEHNVPFPFDFGQMKTLGRRV